MEQPEIKSFKDLYHWFIDRSCRVNFRNLSNSIIFILSTISSVIIDSFLYRWEKYFTLF